MQNTIISEFDASNNAWEVAFSGEYDIFNATEMKENLLDLIKKHEADLIINFENLNYLDSTAIGALVSVHKGVKSYNGKIIFKNLKPNILKLFKITNLDQLFQIDSASSIN